MFKFNGQIEISKSWMNRALIIQSYSYDLEIHGHSFAEDVIYLKNALLAFKNGETSFDVGHGGTTFRFLAFRVSRKPGRYLIQVSDSLRRRPSQEMISILQQLSVRTFWSDEGFHIESQGWKSPQKPLRISVSESSQFLSALALNAIDLDFHLTIENLPATFNSQSYFKLTEDLLLKCGIHWGKPHQNVQIKSIMGEIDYSSAFSLAAATVLAGETVISSFEKKSLQPDSQFLKFFDQMGIRYQLVDQKLQLQSQNRFSYLDADLSDCPDLFPVLATLCAFADGVSHLKNAPQLKFKESDRIAKMAELLDRCGFRVEPKDDGMIVHGNPNHQYLKRDLILFDTAKDHRLAMAAGLLILKGFPIRMNDTSVINKSYPQFFNHIGLTDL